MMDGSPEGWRTIGQPGLGSWRRSGFEDSRAPRTRDIPGVCRFGRSCHREACRYSHPEGPPSSGYAGGSTPCRFGRSCHREDCRYTHPPGHDPFARNAPAGPGGGAMGAAFGSDGPRPCRYGRSCHREDCRYSHPPKGRDGAEDGGGGGGGGLDGASRPCRYGRVCRREDCHFAHPEGKLAPHNGGSYLAAGSAFLDDDLQHYKSAGITFVRAGASGPEALLSIEPIRNEPLPQLSFIGGKRAERLDRSPRASLRSAVVTPDEPARTAVREFSETSNLTIKRADLLTLLRDQVPADLSDASAPTESDAPPAAVVWIGKAKYVLYVVRDAGGKFADIPDEFAKSVQQMRMTGCEALELAWVPIEDLVRARDDRGSTIRVGDGDYQLRNMLHDVASDDLVFDTLVKVSQS